MLSRSRWLQHDSVTSVTCKRTSHDLDPVHLTHVTMFKTSVFVSQVSVAPSRFLHNSVVLTPPQCLFSAVSSSSDVPYTLS